MHTQMPFVSAKQFIWPLTYQGNLHILSRPLRDEIHRNDGRSRNGFLQTLHDPWQRSFKLGSVELYHHMPGAKKRGRLRCVGQLVVLKCLAVTYCVSGPGAALFVH